MTHFATRPCKLGQSVNTRTEKHGDDSVPACDIPVSGFMLEKAELDELVGKDFWNCMFNNGNGKKADMPLWEKLATMKLADKYSGGVTIVLGPNVKDIELEDVTIAGITLEPLAGGLTAVSFKIQASDDVEKFVHKLIARLDTEIDLQVEFGDKVERAKSKQQDLPINTFGDGEQKGATSDEEAGRAHATAFENGTPAGKRNGSRPAAH